VATPPRDRKGGSVCTRAAGSPRGSSARRISRSGPPSRGPFRRLRPIGGHHNVQLAPPTAKH